MCVCNYPMTLICKYVLACTLCLKHLIKFYCRCFMLRIDVRVLNTMQNYFSYFLNAIFISVRKQKYTVKTTELSHENDITWGYIVTLRIDLSTLVAVETNISCIWQFYVLRKQKHLSLNRDYKHIYSGMAIQLGICRLEISWIRKFIDFKYNFYYICISSKRKMRF